MSYNDNAETKKTIEELEVERAALVARVDAILADSSTPQELKDAFHSHKASLEFMDAEFGKLN